VLVLAHRGLHQAGGRPLCQENTVAAFDGVASTGADGVELDVRLCVDGTLAVHHDPTIRGVGEIAEMGARDLPRWVPTLPVALEAARALSVVNVELKVGPQGPEPVGRAVAELLVRADLDVTPGPFAGRRVVASSFDPRALAAVRAAAPAVATALLGVARVAPTDVEGCVGVNLADETVSQDCIEAAHGRGLVVAAWTVDTLERILELAGWGLDAVITNEPAAAVAAVRVT